jgi:uncharacterized membrane protein YraQ (UPF0718 family)
VRVTRTLPSGPSRADSPLRPPRRGRGRRGLLVGLALLAAVLLIRATAPGDIGGLLSVAARDATTLAISVVLESLPFVFLGILLSIIVQVWLPPQLLLRRLPRNAALRRAVLSLLGILLPVCECGNLPLARGLMSRGLSVSDSMTFLLAAPILNPVTVITTYQAFGWSDGILVSRVLGGFAIANLIGWLYSRHPRPDTMLTARFQEVCAAERRAPLSGDRFRRSVALFADETSAMLPALFIGSAIAGIIQVGVSRELLISLGGNPVWSVFALMLLAFVVALCSNVDAFFVLALGSSFTPGAVIAFLLFGPMIDIKMLAMMRTTFTARALVQLTALVALLVLVIGLSVNLLA